jgi:hypothetical protein
VLTRDANKRIKDYRGAWRNLAIRAELGRYICAPCAKLGKDIRVTGEKKCPECQTQVRSRTRLYRGLIPHDMRRSAAKAARRAGVPESVAMAMGGWRTNSMFRRYAIVSSADQRAAAEMIEKARAATRTEFGTEPSKTASEEVKQDEQEKRACRTN